MRQCLGGRPGCQSGPSHHFSTDAWRSPPLAPPRKPPLWLVASPRHKVPFCRAFVKASIHAQACMLEPAIGVGHYLMKKAAGRPGAALQSQLAAVKTGHQRISSVGKNSLGSLTCLSAAKVHVCMVICHAQCSWIVFRDYCDRIKLSSCRETA